MIVLGDAGINFFGGWKDAEYKRYIKKIPITFLLLTGNHDIRPAHVTHSYCSGTPHPLLRGVMMQDSLAPNVLYTPMYGAFSLFTGGRWVKTFCICGAYSVDKSFRVACDYPWFSDEQLKTWEMKEAQEMIVDAQPEIILSHTCPHKYIPRDMFLTQVDQSTVDDTMERWLDGVEESVPYSRWYCGHWHTDRTVDRMRFMFNDIVELKEE